MSLLYLLCIIIMYISIYEYYSASKAYIPYNEHLRMVMYDCKDKLYKHIIMYLQACLL